MHDFHKREYKYDCINKRDIQLDVVMKKCLKKYYKSKIKIYF